MKYQYTPGWNKEKVMAQIKKYNNGTKAVSVLGNCAYQSMDGNRCAIGCFLPEGSHSTESGHVGFLLHHYPDLTQYMPIEYNGLMGFQRAHDGCFNNLSTYENIEKWLDMNMEEPTV